MKKSLTNFIWHAFILVLSLASLAEVIFGFIPLNEKIDSYARTFFMGLALIGFFYEIIDKLISKYIYQNDLNKMVSNNYIINS